MKMLKWILLVAVFIVGSATFSFAAPPPPPPPGTPMDNSLIQYGTMGAVVAYGFWRMRKK